MRTKIARPLSSLRDLNTYVSTFGTPIILRGLYGRPQNRIAIKIGPSLSVRCVQWRGNYASILILNGIAASTTSTSLCDFLLYDSSNDNALIRLRQRLSFADIPAAYP